MGREQRMASSDAKEVHVRILAGGEDQVIAVCTVHLDECCLIAQGQRILLAGTQARELAALILSALSPQEGRHE